MLKADPENCVSVCVCGGGGEGGEGGSPDNVFQLSMYYPEGRTDIP